VRVTEGVIPPAGYYHDISGNLLQRRSISGRLPAVVRDYDIAFQPFAEIKYILVGLFLDIAGKEG